MSNHRKLPDVIEFPCSFCCKPMSFSKKTFIKGGSVKCLNCGLTTRFRPHPNAGRRKATKSWHGGDPQALSPA